MNTVSVGEPSHVRADLASRCARLSQVYPTHPLTNCTHTHTHTHSLGYTLIEWSEHLIRTMKQMKPESTTNEDNGDDPTDLTLQATAAFSQAIELDPEKSSLSFFPVFLSSHSHRSSTVCLHGMVEL